MNRDALIELLRDHGFEATKRDWSMGETVLVTHERLRQEDRGITVWRDAVYVRAEVDGAWTVTTPTFAEEPIHGLTALIEYLSARLA